MTLLRRGRILTTIALLTSTLLLAACGATAVAPEEDTATIATFGEATFDASTWR